MAKYAQNGHRMHLLQSRISTFSGGVPPTYQRGGNPPLRLSGTQLSPYFINWDSYFNSFCTLRFMLFTYPYVVKSWIKILQNKNEILSSLLPTNPSTNTTSSNYFTKWLSNVQAWPTVFIHIFIDWLIGV